MPAPPESISVPSMSKSKSRLVVMSDCAYSGSMRGATLRRLFFPDEEGR